MVDSPVRSEASELSEPFAPLEPCERFSPSDPPQPSDPQPSVGHPADAFSGAVGLGAAELLAGLVLADVDDFTLGEALCTAERVASWAASMQASIVQEMTARAGAGAEWVRDEVAALLRLTGRSAQILTDRAEVLDAVPELHDALAAGQVDARRVDVVVRTAAPMGVTEMREVVRQVLPRAGQMTGPELRDGIRTLGAARDPAAYDKRAAAARGQRCVRMEPAPDAMAWLTAYLPAEDAMAVWVALDALAHTPGAVDAGTLDERRADALSHTMRQVLDRSAAVDGTPLSRAQGQRPHLSVIASPELLVPGAVGIATLEGYGPIPASVARTIAAQANWQAIGIDPRTGEAAGVSSGCYQPSPELAAALTAPDPDPQDEADTDQPPTDQPSTDQPSTDQPSTDQSSTDRPDTHRPPTGRPPSGGPPSDGRSSAGPPPDKRPPGEPPPDERPSQGQQRDDRPSQGRQQDDRPPDRPPRGDRSPGDQRPDDQRPDIPPPF